MAVPGNSAARPTVLVVEDEVALQALIFTALEEAGFADNTIIVYSADNGYHMGNRGFAGKWSHYEESLRVPLIIADPRIPAPQTIADAFGT